MQNDKLTPEQEMARRTRRSFLALGAGVAAAGGGWFWLQSQPDADGVPLPLRKVFGLNEKVIRGSLYNNGHLAPTYPAICHHTTEIQWR